MIDDLEAVLRQLSFEQQLLESVNDVFCARARNLGPILPGLPWTMPACSRGIWFRKRGLPLAKGCRSNCAFRAPLGGAGLALYRPLFAEVGLLL